MLTAIIDYGSGNLRSAAKAFERAGGESGGAERSIVVTSRPGGSSAAPTASCCPGRAPLPIAGAGSPPCPASRTRIDEAVIARGRPFFGICVGMQLMAERGREFETVAGLGWIPRRGRGASSRAEPGAEDPAYGLERARPASRRIRCSHGVAGGDPRLFRPLLSTSPCADQAMCWRRPIMAGADRRGRPRQSGRHAVPPRKEPGCRACG